MKEMIYKGSVENEQKVIDMLDEGIYKGFHYVIVSYGIHPCAYIEIPKDNVSDEDKLIDIDCHGGITYVSTTGLIKPNNENHRDGHWIGWDYAHACDYIGYLPVDFTITNGLKKWTTKEILEEVKDVIEQLIKS